MIDLKFLRENPDIVKENIKKNTINIIIICLLPININSPLSYLLKLMKLLVIRKYIFLFPV